MIQTTGKNYAVEFYRILATVLICAHHLYKFPLEYDNLAVCVEFFFLLSGYFLMRTYDREERHSCAAFAKRRLSRLYPEYLLAYLVLLPGLCLFHGEHLRLEVIVPELALLKSTGLFYDGYNYPGWYVCTLFWGELILYCLISHNRKRFTNVVAPLLVLFGYTWLFNCGRGIGNLELWDSYFPMLRALCGLSLGVLIHEAQRSDLLAGLKLWQGTVLEAAALGVIVYSLATDANLWALAILGFVVLLVVTTGQRGYLSSVIFNQKFFGSLSALTYGMYLNQALVILFVWYVAGQNYGLKAWVVYYVTLVIAAAAMHLAVGWLRAFLRKRREPAGSNAAG